MKKIRETVSYYRQQLKHWYIVALLLVGYDIVAVNMAYFFALWFRFDCKASMIPGNYFSAYLKFIPIYSICCVLIFWMLRLYQSIWRFASYSEMLRIIMATVITSVVHIVGITVLFSRMPISYYLVGMGIQFLLILGVRFSYRFMAKKKPKMVKLPYVSRVKETKEP